MKRFFLAALAIIAIASCAKNEVSEVTDNNQITFQTVVGPATKALITGTAYAESNTFGTVVYKGEELYIPTNEVTYNGTNKYWSTATAYYWPKDGSSLTFYSYSPFEDENGDEISVAHTKGGLTINYSVAALQETDLMVAIPTTQSSNTETIGSWKTGVPTVFGHKLAQVVAINFQTVAEDGTKVKDYAGGRTTGSYVVGDKVFTVKSVALKNVFETGTYTNVSSEGWATTGTATASLPWHTNSSSTPFEDGEYNTDRDTKGYLLVIPQTFAADKQMIEITYTIGTYNGTDLVTETITETVDLADLHAKWEMNKKYTYTVKIGLDRIYWAPSVVEWESETVTAAPEDVI